MLNDGFPLARWFPMPAMISQPRDGFLAQQFPMPTISRPKHDFWGEVNFLCKGKGWGRHRWPCDADMCVLPHRAVVVGMGGVGVLLGCFCPPPLCPGGATAARSCGGTGAGTVRP